MKKFSKKAIAEIEAIRIAYNKKYYSVEKIIQEIKNESHEKH